MDILLNIGVSLFCGVVLAVIGYLITQGRSMHRTLESVERLVREHSRAEIELEERLLSPVADTADQLGRLVAFQKATHSLAMLIARNDDSVDRAEVDKIHDQLIEELP